MTRLSKTIKAALLFSLATFAGLSAAASGPNDQTAPSQAAGSDVSYVACYFNNNNNVTWKWGLTPANDWYSFSGAWFKTPYTKLEKFRANSATHSDLRDACENAKKYYKVQGELFALFAATSSTGSNYPILLANNVELYPQY
ncbi:hypothetical protein [Chromobacterium vaccinii]|uniref:hypothetical protein n=1 Tax=Chromobacterium vaccinii TaxID=1108595 RepID=UPI000617F8BC|nr:hypothetical protein [Chromobacterium vaccinii]QND85770.1 Uncharacterized protein ChrSW_3544 [Chromobacterium vaccinii]QND91001.1 Uncharacterized protein ChrSV_3544 [Chromobacterium vaccinii]